MGPDFEIEILRRPDVVVLSVVGEVDVETAPWLDGQLSLALASNVPRVILELERVTFIDAHGLRLLMRHTRSREHGDRLALESPSFPVQRMFALSGAFA